jgi:membrane protein YdbS with pleckstrin-like domain
MIYKYFFLFFMPLNTELKLLSKLKWLALAQLLLLSFVISFVIALFGGGSAGVGFFTFFFVLIVLPLWLYKIVAFNRVSFTVTDGTLTINSGILIRRSNAISFAQIQNISNTKGPLAAMFNLAELNVWTASPAQIRVRKDRTEHRPTGMLWLETGNAEWLKNFILEKRAK